jgi:hypothetical protein
LFSKLVDIHFIASFRVWKRSYQPPVTDPVTSLPCSWL